MNALRPPLRKLLNSPDAVVQESLAGFAAAYADLVHVDLETQLVIRRNAPTAGKVGVVSGGGSGHEPLDSGFVGSGMLDAACLGEIFTAPPPNPIVRAASAVDGGAGVVCIVKNYTGDVMNFRLAADAALKQGLAVEIVHTTDDIATSSNVQGVGRRGTGLTPIVQKLAGARAESGASLSEVAELARRVNDRGRSIGVALSFPVTRALGGVATELAPGEMEFGVGIHGEPGRQRDKLVPVATVVERMVDEILQELHAPDGSEVLAFVNGFGGTPLMELYIAYKELVTVLNRRGLNVTRRLIGNYVTSLEMAGMSITLLGVDTELTALWDSPVQTVSLRW